jgi:His/Glu/Gln/Arg/opine family amino acid ABC transporter permease subunit
MNLIVENFPYLAKAALETVWLSAVSIAISIALGTPIGVLAAFGVRPIIVLNQIGVLLVRGIPVLVIIYFTFFSLPLIKVFIDPYSTAVIALSGYFTFFVSEIVRGTVASVPRGQIDAGKSIGLSFWRRARLIVLPIASRAALPPLINVCITVVKATSYATVISAWELATASNEVAQRTVAPFQIYGVALFLYFVICFALTRLAGLAEARLAFKH